MALILSGLYILSCVVLYIIQDHFIFNAYPLPADYTFNTGQEIELPLDDGLSMNCLLIPQNQSHRPNGAILYLHGTRGNIRFGIHQTRQMTGLGYDIFIPDYRSYGKTEGRIVSEQQLYNDVQVAYDYLSDRYDKIIIIGYSLGTGMASYLSQNNDPLHLVLVAPFTSLTDIKNKFLWMFPDFILKYKLPVEHHLEFANCDVTIVHGTDDEVVDYDYSVRLKELFPNKINLITAHNQSHRGVIFSEELRREIRTQFMDLK